VRGPGGTGRNRLDGHLHLDTVIETVADGHQPVSDEAGKLRIADTRNSLAFTPVSPSACTRFRRNPVTAQLLVRF
jgi:hypothetical protein